MPTPKPRNTRPHRQPAAEPADSNNLGIGERTRHARKEAGMTLAVLSRASGVSKAMLSQIEQNKANPTVAVLHKIATALNTTVGDLIDQPDPEPLFEVIRAGDPHHVWTSHQPCSGRSLSPLWMEKSLEFFDLSFPKGGELASKPHAAGTIELATVMKGEVEVKSGGRVIKLLVGDSATYSADVEHHLRNTGRGEANVLLVVSYSAPE
jgi:transcriptional regulator with XRE-family HTH domain